jgi:hypothetical protein
VKRAPVCRREKSPLTQPSPTGVQRGRPREIARTVMSSFFGSPPRSPGYEAGRLLDQQDSAAGGEPLGVLISEMVSWRTFRVSSRRPYVHGIVAVE